jgi:hypothetical protein
MNFTGNLSLPLKASRLDDAVHVQLFKHWYSRTYQLLVASGLARILGEVESIFKELCRGLNLNALVICFPGTLRQQDM